ncbi:MAG: DUF72 domain-containing protein [Gammaproteobacteria bacterium]|nr:DUF72 domain-containing protein [Gammaproteobacteria bacterium]
MGVQVGCCGFGMARGRYYRRFSLVEVQQTFYQPPRVRTLERWRAEAPEHFAFTLKAWQLITHEASSPTYRRLREPIPPRERGRYGSFRANPQVRRAWRTTLACARALEAPVVVFQCPAAFTPTGEHLDDMYRFFEDAWADADDLIFAFEPRGRWRAAQIKAVCRDLDLVHIVDPLKDAPRHGRARYYRLHGLTGYRYRHTRADLERLAEACGGRKRTYCLFNNMTMADDAARFLRVLEETGR